MMTIVAHAGHSHDTAEFTAVINGIVSNTPLLVGIGCVILFLGVGAYVLLKRRPTRQDDSDARSNKTEG